MHAIEFIAEIEDGIIKVPKKYQDQLSKKFRVIILQDDETADQTKKLSKKRTFDAVRVTTKDLTFDRDEANER